MPYSESPFFTTDFNRGFSASRSRLAPELAGHTAEGSSNSMILGDGYRKPFRGLDSQGAATGSRLMKQIGKTWGGIKDINHSDRTFIDIHVSAGTDTVTFASPHGLTTGTAAQLTTTGVLPVGLNLLTTYYLIAPTPTTLRFASTFANSLTNTAVNITDASGGGTHTVDVDNTAVLASGNVFEDIGRSLWGIGSGQVHVEGANVPGFTLSTLLKVALLVSGSYGAPQIAGLAQPSAAEIGVTTSVGNVDGSVSCKIERRRPSTGGKSLASPTSAIVIGQNNKIRVTFPAAVTGQTHWAVFFTLMKFGGRGIHYRVAYSGSLDITEAAVAAGTVDGIARSLEFDWKDGDLVPEEANFDSYAPPAGTHAMRLENAMIVLGCYADSVSAPTSTSTGVAAAVSKPNDYEAYNPLHLLFLPEQIVDVLSRAIDSYGYIACENSIHALQYVGPREENLPACTITTILPDIGIKYAHNWTHFLGRIALYTAEGNLLVMTESGEIINITSSIRKFIKGWLPEDTKVGYCPKNDCIVLANGRVFICYSLQRQEWSDPIYIQDYGFATTATITSCQSAKRRLYVSVTDGSSVTAYEFDKGYALPIPLSFVTHYTGAGAPSAAKNIYQFSVSAETNYISAPVVVCINRNLQKIAFRRAGVNGATSVISDAENSFNSSMVGKRFAFFAPDVGGTGVHYIKGIVSAFNNPGEIAITTDGGAPIVPNGVWIERLLFIGDYVETQTLDASGAEHLPDFFPNVPDCRSFAAAFHLMANDDTGSILDASFYGSINGTSRLTS